MASLATDMEQLSVQENEDMHLQKISGKKVPLDAENWFLKNLPAVKAQVVLNCADADWDADKKGYANHALVETDNGRNFKRLTVDQPDWTGKNFDEAVKEFLSDSVYEVYDVCLGAPSPCLISDEKILDHEVCLKTHIKVPSKFGDEVKKHWLKMFLFALKDHPCYFHIDRVTGYPKKLNEKNQRVESERS
jgi:hypothetical protein